MDHALGRRAGLALVAVLVAGALSSPTATAGTEPDPMAGAPAVGDCFDITMKEGQDDSLDQGPVECTEGHTAVVAAVGQLPARLDWDSPRDQINKATAKVCARGFDDLIGSKNQLLRWYRSQYSLWEFNPTQAQRDDGARWFDCMVSIAGAHGLRDLPEKLPRLTNHLPDTVARCVTSKNVFATCAEKHAWRSSYAFFARGKATDRAVDAAAQRICPQHVSSRTWLRSVWDVPGNRFAIACYSKTRG